MKTLQDRMYEIKNKLNEEEYAKFEQMKVSNQLIYKNCALKVEVGSRASLDLTDD